LADEINRATPKTQSALLEAMQERQVTIGETTHLLGNPFWVLATQNPLEHEGVYVLPEAQVDRFALKITVDYPSLEHEIDILSFPLVETEIEAVIDPDDILWVRDKICQIHVDSRIHRYIVLLGRATRAGNGTHPPRLQEFILSGASPRAQQHLLALARVVAFLDQRLYVLPEDVKSIAVEALQHRIVRSVQAEAEGVFGADIVKEVLNCVSIP
jgi:MoxR-like ATPase